MLDRGLGVVVGGMEQISHRRRGWLMPADKVAITLDRQRRRSIEAKKLDRKEERALAEEGMTGEGTPLMV
jgi:hypothetical protein